MTPLQGDSEYELQLVKKKRGGQPGNSNAFKHGFYTKNFSPAERRALDATNAGVLRDEISLLRVLIKRFADQVQSGQVLGLPESAHYLTVISEAMVRLASLLRTDHMMGGSEANLIVKKFDEMFTSICNDFIEEAALPGTNPLREAAKR